MKKIVLFQLFMVVLLPAPSLPHPVEGNPHIPLLAFEIGPIKKISDQVTEDSFGLIPRGSLTIKKEMTNDEKIKPRISLAQVTAGLKLYGLFPNEEAIVNSMLWKLNSKLTVRFQNHDYLLTLKEITENDIKIGWLENDPLHQISLAIPPINGFSEPPEQGELESTESKLVLENTDHHNPLK